MIEYDHQVINDDRVKIEVIEKREPMPMSPYGDNVFGYQMIKASINQVWKSNQVVVAPGKQSFLTLMFYLPVWPIKINALFLICAHI